MCKKVRFYIPKAFLSFRHGLRNPPSRLPPRSVLLLRRGVRRTPAPLTQGRLFLVHDTVSVSTSVGASALHRCPPDTRTPNTGEATICTNHRLPCVKGAAADSGWGIVTDSGFLFFARIYNAFICFYGIIISNFSAAFAWFRGGGFIKINNTEFTFIYHFAVTLYIHRFSWI